jgi:hypothetical protein
MWEKGLFKVVRDTSGQLNNKHSIVRHESGTKHIIPVKLIAGCEIELEFLDENGKYRFNLNPFNRESYVDKTFEINIIRIDENNSRKFFIGAINGIAIKIPFINWQYSSSFLPPNKIKIRGVKNDLQVRFKQIIDESNGHPFFVEGEVYKFKVLRIESSPKSSNGLITVEGIDKIEYTIPAYWNFNYAQKAGKQIELRFSGYLESGNLKLDYIEKAFITLSDVFSNIYATNRLKEICGVEVDDNPKYISFINQYDNKDNRWVLSLSKLFYEVIRQCLFNVNYPKALLILDVFNELEHYIVDSNYAELFTIGNRGQIKSTGKNYIKIIDNLREPILNLNNLTYDHYLTSIAESINSTSSNIEIENCLSKGYNLLVYAPKKYLATRTIFDYFSKILYVKKSEEIIDLLNRTMVFLNTYTKDRETQIFNRAFFNNIERKNHYYQNNDLTILINLYKLNYLAAKYNNTEDTMLWLSKIARCIYLFSSDDILSTNLGGYIIKSLEERTEPDLRFVDFYTYDTDIVAYTKQIGDQYFPHGHNLKLNYGSNIEIKLNGEKETIHGYTTIYKDTTTIISKSSMLDYEFGYYCLNKGSKNAEFTVSAYNNYTNKTLIRYNRSYLFKESNVPYYTEGSRYQLVEGYITNVRGTYAYVILSNGQKGYINRQDISYTLPIYIPDILVPGKKYNFLIDSILGKDLTAKLSRKNFYTPQWKELQNKKNVTCEGTFLRVITLNNIIKHFDINLPDEEETLIFQTKCPKCHNLESLIIDRVESKWNCTNAECDFNGKESLLFYVRDFNILVFAEIDDYTINYIGKIKRGQIAEVSLHFFTETSIIKAEINTFFNSFDGDYIFCTPSVTDFKIYSQLAEVYEDLASISTTSDEEINWLYWAQHYYSLVASNKSFFYNLYIPYLYAITILEKLTTANYKDVLSKLTSYVKSILSDPSIEETVLHFPILEKHKKLFEIINQINLNEQLDDNRIINDYVNLPPNDATINEVTRLIISYNLLSKNTSLVDESNFIFFILHNLKNVLTAGRIVTSVDVDFTQTEKERNEEFYRIIGDTENHNLEFKSSLYTPTQDSERQKAILEVQTQIDNSADASKIPGLQRRLERLQSTGTKDDVILSSMKTIAAFANSNGGTLIIGVDDNKVILGLDNDYSSISTPNKIDGFQLRFDEYVKDYLGGFAQSILTYKIWHIDGKDIFQVDVKALSIASDPIVVQKKNMPSLYIRASGSTRELNVLEAMQYFKNRSSGIVIE